jgi:hypothetical protein
MRRAYSDARPALQAIDRTADQRSPIEIARYQIPDDNFMNGTFVA